jgi:hypothetical protein
MQQITEPTETLEPHLVAVAVVAVAVVPLVLETEHLETLVMVLRVEFLFMWHKEILWK